MGLVLKYVAITPTGAFVYRRRVPKAVSGIITKREFKQKLGDTEREALAAYPRVHARIEQEIALAHRRMALGEEAQRPRATERQAYEEALRQRNEWAALGSSAENLELMGDLMLESYPVDGRGPVGVPSLERHKINLLRLGPERYGPPEATLTDALRVYLSLHLDADHPDTDRRLVRRAERAVELAQEVWGRDPLLTSITRDMARAVWDHMQNRLKSTGDRVSHATAVREFGGLAAIVAFAAREFDLPESVVGPFRAPATSKPRREQGVTAASKREPLPSDVLEQVGARIAPHASPDVALVWRLLVGTGCRLAEVTGLRVEDVDVQGEWPHIHITPNPLRSLKTEAAQRLVPLVGDALEAAKEALAMPRDGHMLFPRYGRNRGSDTASQTLMKHIRNVTDNPKHVVHSLRHNMKDRLVLAEVSTLEQNLLLGHAAQGTGDRVYGGDVAKLRAVTRAMQRAMRDA